MSAELKPCPFCGGEATDVHISGTAWFIGADHAPDCHFADFQRSEAEAIAAWSRRPPQDTADGWQEITEDNRPPNDIDVLMGCWESWPEKEWRVEYGHYGSTKGGWIHGRMTHWLPAGFLPEPPAPGSSS